MTLGNTSIHGLGLNGNIMDAEQPSIPLKRTLYYYTPSLNPLQGILTIARINMVTWTFQCSSSLSLVHLWLGYSVLQAPKNCKFKLLPTDHIRNPKSLNLSRWMNFFHVLQLGYRVWFPTEGLQRKVSGRTSLDRTLTDSRKLCGQTNI